MIVQVVAKGEGKKGTIVQGKVDDEKSTSECDVIEVIIKNTTEKVVMDTGQYNVVCNMVDVKDKEYYVRLDSRTASEVNGRKTLKVYNLVKATEVVYYRRKDKGDQSMFEDHNHRMVTTMTLNVKSDYISTDHKGKEMFYGFKDKFVEEYKVGHYIAADPGG